MMNADDFTYVDAYESGDVLKDKCQMVRNCCIQRFYCKDDRVFILCKECSFSRDREIVKYRVHPLHQSKFTDMIPT